MRRAARLAALAAVATLLLGAGRRPSGLGDVTNVELVQSPDQTRVVVQLSRATTYEVHRIADPERLYLDIDGVWIEAPLRAERVASELGPIAKVRGGQNTLERARVVIELGEGGGEYRTYHLENPFRIVTEVRRAEAGENRASAATALDFDSRPVQRIVIDPGHGGRDPGARSRSGVSEKDVSLAIARHLRTRLQQEGLEAYLTRDTDVFLPLEERTAIADRLQGDLFISIHANASYNRRTQGVESYLLDTRFDRQTARVAARENGTTVRDLSEVQRILAALRLGYNERYAARLAEHLQRSLVAGLRRNYGATRDLGVKHGPFLVLFMADMPAVLVEVGFLSHREEGRRLGGARFARSAADGIAAGILAYRGEHARRLMAER